MFLIKSLYVVLASAQIAYSAPSTCDFYSHKSRSLHCSSGNFFETFLERYCRFFEAAEGNFSRPAQKTFSRIRSCLISTIEAESELTCESVARVSRAAHLTCYTKNGFCELGMPDRWRALQIVWRELSDSSFRESIWQINAFCKSQRRVQSHEGAVPTFQFQGGS